MVPKDKSYVPTGVTLMGIVAYNKQKVPNPPTTWQALESSTWKGQVGMNDPSQSGPTYPLIAGVMNYLGGVSAGEKYFSTLKSNGLVIHPTNGPTLQALTSGQINLALVQSSAAIGATFTDKNIGIEYLDPATLLPSAIGIDAKASPQVQAEAKKFVEFVLSTAGQKVMQTGDPTGDSLYYPVAHRRQPAVLAALAGVGQDPDDQPVHLGHAGGDHQHLVRLEHRPLTRACSMTTAATPDSALSAGRRGAPRFSPASGLGPAWLRPARFGMPVFWLILCAHHPAALRSPSWCSASRRGCSTRGRSGSR